MAQKPMPALVRVVVEKAGGPTRLARILDVTPATFFQWSRIPGHRVIALEALTGIPRRKLRRDLYPTAKEEAALARKLRKRAAIVDREMIVAKENSRQAVKRHFCALRAAKFAEGLAQAVSAGRVQAVPPVETPPVRHTDKNNRKNTRSRTDKAAVEARP